MSVQAANAAAYKPDEEQHSDHPMFNDKWTLRHLLQQLSISESIVALYGEPMVKILDTLAFKVRSMEQELRGINYREQQLRNTYRKF